MTKNGEVQNRSAVCFQDSQLLFSTNEVAYRKKEDLFTLCNKVCMYVCMYVSMYVSMYVTHCICFVTLKCQETVF